jgi:asparagine synthase (glutamine-hydrolysing)
MADKTAAAFQLEPRYPFLDRRLVELCLAMPAEQKLRAGWTRAVLRHAMAGILPEEVRWRARKANLLPSFVRTLHARDRDVVQQAIGSAPGTIGEYVDTARLRQVHERYMSGPISDADALTVFRAVTLALWLRQGRGDRGGQDGSEWEPPGGGQRVDDARELQATACVSAGNSHTTRRSDP